MTGLNSDGAVPVPLRLPHHVVPLHYALTLKPDFDQYSFEGHVDIDLGIVEETNSVLFHSSEIELYNVKLRSNTETLVYFESRNIQFDKGSGIANVTFTEPLHKDDSMTLMLDFKGKISGSSYGFFRNQLYMGNDVNLDLWSTNFDPNYAHTLFPCWDEPGFKSTYEVSLEVPDHFTTLSNTDIVSTVSTKDAFKRVTFGKTPPMTTHSLALVISDLHYVERLYFSALNNNTIRCRVYSQRKINPAMDFIVDESVKYLEYFETLFEIPYEFNKLDIVTTHDGYGAGKKWGLITIDDSLETVFESSEYHKSTSVLIAKHIAHQWFGGLVSVNWWSELWLTEGFNQYFGLFATETLHPDYGVIEKFYKEKLEPYQLFGNFKDSPIHQAVSNPRTLPPGFGNAVYNRGTIVLGMLKKMIPGPEFVKIVRSYLREHRYHSAEIVDFFKEAKHMTEKNLDSFFNAWIENNGHPYLEVTEKDGPKTGEITLKIQQHPYSTENNQAQLFYPMPVTVVTFSGEKKFTNIILLNNVTEVIIDKNTPYFFNTDENSLYHTQYSSSGIKKLKNLFESKLLDSHERIRLIRDTGLLFHKFGHSTALLELLQILSKEDDRSAWFYFMEYSDQFFRLWSNVPEFEPSLAKVRFNLYSPHLIRRPITDILSDPTPAKTLQYISLRNVVLSGDSGLQNEINELFDKLAADTNSTATLKYDSLIFLYIQNGPLSHVEKLIDLIPTGNSRPELKLKSEILYSLAFCHVDALPGLLEWGLARHSLNYIYSSLQQFDAPNQKVALDFLIKKWHAIIIQYDKEIVKMMIRLSISNIASLDYAKKLKDFFFQIDLDMPLDDWVSEIEARHQMIQNNQNALAAALKNLS